MSEFAIKGCLDLLPEARLTLLIFIICVNLR